LALHSAAKTKHPFFQTVAFLRLVVLTHFNALRTLKRQRWV
jgi:hypothetical protein